MARHIRVESLLASALCCPHWELTGVLHFPGRPEGGLAPAIRTVPEAVVCPTRIALAARHPMIAGMQDRQDHFAYCVQLVGGTTAFSRRLRIDERAIRRFINGERPISNDLYRDTATALRELIAEATAAEGQISASLASEPSDP